LACAQESLKLLYRAVEDSDEVDEDGVAGAERWSEQTYHHVDVVAADHVFTDNSDAVVNTETRSVRLAPGNRPSTHATVRQQSSICR